MLTVAYIVLAGIGCGYVLVAAFLGHLAESGGNGHQAGHEASTGAYGVEGGGHGAAHASAGAGASFHFPFFSPLALATFAAALGAWGLIAQYALGLRDEVSLAVAVPAAVATAWAVTYLSWRLVSGSRGTSAIRLGELAGAAGEVTTPIPAGGVGEVATIVAGQRFTAPAREAEGGAVPRGATVTVVRMVGGTLLVTAEPVRRETTHA